MHIDALQHIHEPGVRIHIVQPAGLQQALNDPHRLRADLGPAEQMVPASECNRAQRALQMIGVDRHVGIAEEYLQTGAACPGVLQRCGKRILWYEIHPLSLLVAPGPDAVTTGRLCSLRKCSLSAPSSRRSRIVASFA